MRLKSRLLPLTHSGVCEAPNIQDETRLSASEIHRHSLFTRYSPIITLYCSAEEVCSASSTQLYILSIGATEQQALTTRVCAASDSHHKETSRKATTVCVWFVQSQQVKRDTNAVREESPFALAAASNGRLRGGI